jgi:predicted permease
LTLALSFALRSAQRQPVQTTMVLATLAFGIAAATVPYTLVRSILVRPLPYRASRELAMLTVRSPQGSTDSRSVAPFYQLAKTFGHTFRAIHLLQPRSAFLSGRGEPTVALSAAVEPQMMSDLGIATLSGRPLLPGDELIGAPPVVLLSERLWRRQLGGDPDVIGQVLRVNDDSYEVVGIVRSGHGYPLWAELWLPLAETETAPATARSDRSLQAVVRLQRGVSAAAARSFLLDHDPGQHQVTLTQLQESLTKKVRRPLLLLQVAGLLVLLLACANAAILLLAQAERQRGEQAIRAALGAPRLRLIRERVAEVLVIAVPAGLLGTLAAWLLPGTIARRAGDQVALQIPVSPDLSVIAFAAALTVVVAVIAAVVPSLIRVAPAEALRAGVGSCRASPPAGRALVTIEITVALMLLLGCGASVTALLRILQQPLGLDGRACMTGYVKLPDWRYPAVEQRRELQATLLERIRTRPQVTAAGIGRRLPGRGYELTVAGPGGAQMLVQINEVSDGYLAAAGIPLLAGSELEDGATGVAVIDQRVAARLYPGGSAVGEILLIDGSPVRVAGVSGTISDPLQADIKPQVYLPPERPMSWVWVLVRSTLSAAQAEIMVKDAVHGIDPQQPVIMTAPLLDHLRSDLWALRFGSSVLTVLSACGLMLAMVGLMATAAVTTARRRYEMAIRRSVGAGAVDVVRLLIGSLLPEVLLGLLLGAASGVGLVRWLLHMFPNIRIEDSWSMLAVVPVMVCAMLLAVAAPLRRAIKEDPLELLRSE